MPTATRPNVQLPPPDVQLIDPRTGKPTQAFLDWLKSLDALIRALRLEIP